MDSKKDALFRLKLSEGFLKEAQEDLRLSRWRSCVDNSQLVVENASKAVIAIFAPIPKSHELSMILDELILSMELPFKDKITRLKELSEELGYDEHIRSDYGEEGNFITPWELFDEEDAKRALSTANEAFNISTDIIGELTK